MQRPSWCCRGPTRRPECLELNEAGKQLGDKIRRDPGASPQRPWLRFSTERQKKAIEESETE